MISKTLAKFSCLALAATMAAGCFVDTDDDPVIVEPGNGTLTVLWTVDGTTDEDACYYWGGGETDLELVIFEGGRLIAEEYAPCEDFEMVLELQDGVYDGEVTMVTPDNDPVSITLPLDNLDVRAGTDLEVDVDFPGDSFL